MGTWVFGHVLSEKYLLSLKHRLISAYPQLSSEMSLVKAGEGENLREPPQPWRSALIKSQNCPAEALLGRHHQRVSNGMQGERNAVLDSNFPHQLGYVGLYRPFLNAQHRT